MRPRAGTGEASPPSLLRDRAFALYLVGQTTSGAGSALSSVALVFAVLSISRSATSVGVVLLASRLPAVVLSLAGGIAADRVSRQRLAMGADLMRTVLQLLTGALLLSGHITVMTLAALQVGSGAASAVFGPAATALLASIAPRGEIRRAASLLGMTTAIAQLGGLALAGTIVAVAGPGTSMLVDGATFAVSSLTLGCAVVSRATIGTKRPAPTRIEPGTAGRPRLADELRDGWRAVSQRSWLLVTACRETVLNVLVLSPFFVLGPVIAKARLGGAPAWSGIALAYVIGNLVAAKITYHWAPRRPVAAGVLVSVLLAPLPLLLGLAAPLWLILAAALLAGAETTIYNTLVTATIQSGVPLEQIGRVTALTNLGSTVLVPVGMGLTGLAAGALGTGTVMVLAAGLGIASTVAALAVPGTWAPLRLDRPASDVPVVDPSAAIDPPVVDPSAAVDPPVVNSPAVDQVAASA